MFIHMYIKTNTIYTSVKFVDVTEEIAPDLLQLGMVTQAPFSLYTYDYDNNKKNDYLQLQKIRRSQHNLLTSR